MTVREYEDLARRLFDTFNREGVEGALQFFDPEIEWIGPPEWLEEHVYRGYDGLRRLAAAWSENFEEYRLELERVIELRKDEILVLSSQRGRIKGSDTGIEQPVGYEWHFRNGKIDLVQVHFSWEAALEAVGVSEEDTHRA